MMKNPINTNIQLLFFQIILLTSQWVSMILAVILFFANNLIESSSLAVCSWLFWNSNYNLKRWFLEVSYEIKTRNRREHRAVMRKLNKKFGAVKKLN